MSQKLIEDRLSEMLDIPKTQADKALNAVIEIIKEETARNGKLSIPNLGVFSAVQRAPRIYRNPKTGERVPKEASVAVKFKAFKSFKEAVN